MAAGAMAVACVLPGHAVAQDVASSIASAQQKTAGSGTAASPQKPSQTAGASNSAAKSTASPKQPHAASHPAADKHPKSSTAIASRDSKTRRVNSRKNGKKSARVRGQEKIDPERAQAIQEALIREHYLSSEAAGSWNQASEGAMRKYQADHGWQSKTVPDSRALISLGLGPNHDHLLNPESAMTTGPEGPHRASLSSTSQNPVSHSADPGALMNVNQSSPAAAPPTANSDHNAAGPQ